MWSYSVAGFWGNGRVRPSSPVSQENLLTGEVYVSLLLTRGTSCFLLYLYTPPLDLMQSGGAFKNEGATAKECCIFGGGSDSRFIPCRSELIERTEPPPMGAQDETTFKIGF